MTSGFQHVHERVQIVVVVFQRFAHGFAHGLESGEMDDGIDVISREQQFRRHCVAEVHLDERDVVSASYFLHAFEAGHVAIRHVIRHDHVVSGLY